jgi:hypothetical protein
LRCNSRESPSAGVDRPWIKEKENTMRTNLRRTLIAAVAATVAFTSIGLTPADARYRHRGNAAAAAAVFGLFGTIAAIAAADAARDDYYGGYYGGPYSYAPAPYYGYGGRGGYRGHWHGGHHWHHHH